MPTSKNTFILDIDDTLYHMDCRLHDRIKKRICDHANKTPELRSRVFAWLGEDRVILPEDLGIIFPSIVATYQTHYPQKLEEYLDEVYGDDYHFIQPDPPLVQTILMADELGKQLVIYSNSPSSQEIHKDFHVQKVLRRLGFPPVFVDKMRLKSYDLLLAVQQGAGKPTLEGMKKFVDYMKIDPADAVFLDDFLASLAAGQSLGMECLWIWNSASSPKLSELAKAKELGINKSESAAQAIHSLLFTPKKREANRSGWPLA